MCLILNTLVLEIQTVELVENGRKPFISRWLNYSLSNTQPLEIEITRFELARNHSELSATLSPQLRRSPTHEEDLSPKMIRHIHTERKVQPEYEPCFSMS